MPTAPDDIPLLTVGDAIADLQNYDAVFEPTHEEIPYQCDEQISEYATTMRLGSTGGFFIALFSVFSHCILFFFLKICVLVLAYFLLTFLQKMDKMYL